MKRVAAATKISRRDFCKACLIGAGGVVLSPLLADITSRYAYAGIPRAKGRGFIKRREALFYRKTEEGLVQCQLCPRRCTLNNGIKGFCRVREPKDGVFYSLVYGNPTAVHVDPIEKKPFYHVLPSTGSFSIATAGCNFRCKYCQNWEISQFSPEETTNYDLPPQSVVDGALRYNCASIAYTYTDPAIFYEYMLDTCMLAKAHGVLNISRTNGYLNKEPVEKLTPYLDATNIDLKGFDQEFYSKIPEGNLKVVQRNTAYFRHHGVHTEITNLIVPTLNDDMEKIRQMCRWIKNEVGKATPVHFSRFHPTFKLRNLHATPIKTLEEARAAALGEGLLYVYIGNVPNHEGNHTYCPNDGKVLIRRVGYRVVENNIKKGCCAFCGYKIYGIWDAA